MAIKVLSRPMKRIADFDVYPLCLGGNVFGWTADEEQSFAVLDAYAAAGGNFIDTADVYSAWSGNGGESETIIGRWMAARGNRDQMIIATKVGMLSGLQTLTPDIDPQSRRGFIAPSGYRQDRSLLRAHRRPEHTNGPDARRVQQVWSKKARCATWARPTSPPPA